MAVAGISLQHYRCISTSVVCCGKRNFRKFLLYNKRGTKLFKERQTTKDRDSDLFHSAYYQETSKMNLELYKCCSIFILECHDIRVLIVSDLGVRPVGYYAGDTFVKVPEMIPELIVPDLTGFQVIQKCKLILRLCS
jgi:large subunit ribosomal protein L41